MILSAIMVCLRSIYNDDCLASVLTIATKINQFGLNINEGYALIHDISKVAGKFV